MKIKDKNDIELTINDVPEVQKAGVSPFVLASWALWSDNAIDLTDNDIDVIGPQVHWHSGDNS